LKIVRSAIDVCLDTPGLDADLTAMPNFEFHAPVHWGLYPTEAVRGPGRGRLSIKGIISMLMHIGNHFYAS